MSTAANKRDPRKYVASKHVTRSRYALGLILAAVVGVRLVSLVDFGSTVGARGAGDGTGDAGLKDPCVVGDFAVEQASNSSGITLAARSTSTFGDLGLTRVPLVMPAIHIGWVANASQGASSAAFLATSP